MVLVAGETEQKNRAVVEPSSNRQQQQQQQQQRDRRAGNVKSTDRSAKPRFACSLINCCRVANKTTAETDQSEEEELIDQPTSSQPPHPSVKQEAEKELSSTKHPSADSSRLKPQPDSLDYSLQVPGLSPLTSSSTCDGSVQPQKDAAVSSEPLKSEASPRRDLEKERDELHLKEPSSPQPSTSTEFFTLSAYQVDPSQASSSQASMPQVSPATESAPLLLPTGAIPSSRRWVGPTPIHLAGRQEELEELLTKVQQLTKDEYLLAAHSEYLKLLQLLDTILVDNQIQVFGLVRPPFYLRLLHQTLKDPEPQILHESPEFIHKEVPTSRSLVRVDTAEFARIWGASPTFARPPSRVGSDWDAERSWLLSRGISKRLEGSEPPHKRPKRTLVGLQGVAEHFAPLGTAILEEPVKVLPLKSQQLDPSDDELAEPGVALERMLESFSGEAENGESKAYFGRRLLHKRVWPLGDLPCIAFTVLDNALDNASSAQLKTLLTAQNNSELLQGKDALDVILKDSFRYTYAGRAVGGLSLPADIQVIFLASSTSPSTDHSHDAAPRDASPQSDGTPHDGSDKMHKGGAEGVVESEAQLWKWFHSFLERIVNNPQIHRMRMQYYQTQRSLTILSADLSNDKSWTVSETKEHKLLWKVLKDGNALCVIEGILNTPLFECLSLLNESDLHKNWMPFLSESGKIYQVAAFAQVIKHRSALPWPLDDRECVLFGYAMDLMTLTPSCVLMNGLSIPDSATSCFGLLVSPPKLGITRLHVKLFTFQLTPIPEDPLKTALKQIVYIDPQVG